ncbi:MAG: lysine exporter LysO family protein [Erysipelotrichaceae bacterium]|nr:lysine exporter LysO family protein [Erysipelotrichaceae bacterium]MDY5252867.1 lysine exporter LysO family protein [Erysipelotrichaceae bacterium]
MVYYTVSALLLGLMIGIGGADNIILSTITQNTDMILYLLMFSVGISIGMQDGVLAKIKQFHIKIFIIPFGIIVASLLGGIICGLITGIPFSYSTAITSGMGWYSLSGATIGKLVNAQLGSIAFLSNLMREIFSFFIIPFIAMRFNYYTCIAPAGATSEDTTLPMMLKYTDEHTVVLSVLNGIICSFFVPILISLCLSF